MNAAKGKQLLTKHL